MIPKIYENLKHIVTYIFKKLKLFPQVRKEGRPLLIKEVDALTFALYKQRSTRATKKSVYDDCDLGKYAHTKRLSFQSIVWQFMLCVYCFT